MGAKIFTYFISLFSFGVIIMTIWSNNNDSNSNNI